MNSRLLTCAAAVILLSPLETRLAAQEQQQQKADKPQHYAVTDLGTLGGTFSEAHGLNNRGSAPGQSTLPGDVALHAFLWQKGVMTDLRTLGGPDSLVPVANHTVSERGAVVGYSEIPTPDPNGEDFCTLGTFLVCLPFVWEKGVMTALPTLGGTNATAAGINSRGQIVGQSETPNPAPICSPFFLQVEAAIWQTGQVQELRPFPGDTDGGGGAINDNGQAVGFTVLCVSAGFGNFHAVLWPNGPSGGVIDLGNLGGKGGNLAFDINNKGQVVGQSDLPGDTVHHGFLWQNGVMIDLGSLAGLPTSLASGINNRGQVVGFSQDANGDDFSSVAWLWQNGVMTDLNNLIPAGSTLFLMEAVAINDPGQIAGFGRLSNGEHRGFLLTPCGEGEEGCAEGAAGTASTIPGSAAPVTQRPAIATPADPVLSGPGMLDRLRTRRFPWYHFAGPGTGPTN